MQPEIEPLLDTTDLARICRSDSDDWIRRGVQRREFPHTRIARKILFTREQAEEIIRLHEKSVQGVPTRDEVADRRSQAGQTSTKPAARRTA